MDDDELLARFEAGTLDTLPHEDHVRVAYLLSRQHAVEDATKRMIDGLRGLAPRFGTSTAFLHVTRTAAWMRIIAGTGGDGTSAAWLTAHPELRRRDLLDDYYSHGRLNNVVAWRRYVQPNKRDFPHDREA
jgi:hypothetical protein